ncbi:DNA-binding HxlR family transcriptional regulator [Mycobacterium frederiksbergense]|uniref:DNA-binding HxlR family transcriptional regulator n=1 Tax=Mycolicibacterium frederiksbergense TaxID=117567 RepID=A0ABT6KS61_9MYCO|nr:helix-turn-helix domain-containing protein [Mycolicibacterium frederiksbergense]MDH6193574.1 DNA-binding HxlR family transcriptional regulator [Mycolicibacterium frederiksbergense]
MRSASGPEFVRRGDDPANAPMLAVMELLGQRWMLRIIWELEPGSLGFLELRRRMGNCSSSMLSERLQQLTAAGLVAKNDTGTWELTVSGVGLGAALSGLWDWSESWNARRTQPS